jgi:hypothetical protein
VYESTAIPFAFVESVHVPPFMHGDDEHSAMLVHFLPPFLVS